MRCVDWRATEIMLAGFNGFLLGVVVTAWLHRGGGYPAGYWQGRIFSSRFRRANLPVGGALAGVAALIAWPLGGPSSKIGAAALGMALAAVGGRIVDPLPSRRSVYREWYGGTVRIGKNTWVPVRRDDETVIYLRLTMLQEDPLSVTCTLTETELDRLRGWADGIGIQFGVVVP